LSIQKAPKRNKSAQVNLRIEPALKSAAEKAAADDHRSLTSLVEKLLTEHLRAKNYLPRSRDADQGLRGGELTSENDG
jgi:hypothetical protein